MGVLRFLLAMAVLTSHVGPFGGWWGENRFPVQVFYMISGFYMAMVWQTTYRHVDKPRTSFYVSRALRIYPVYILILAVTVLTGIYAKSVYDTPATFLLHSDREGFWDAVLRYVPQPLILGADLQQFFDLLPDGAIRFSFESTEKLKVLYLNAVPQAWTLALELYFYLLVPFVLSQLRWTVVLFVASLMLRIGLVLAGHADDPWTHRVFPLELALFLGGALSYSFWEHYRSLLVRTLNLRFLGVGACLAMLALVICFLPLRQRLGESTYWGAFAVAFLALPLLFEVTKESKLDRYIGELSFPIYISHMFVFFFLFSIVHRPSKGLYIMAIPYTILLAMLLSKLQELIDQYRHALRKVAQQAVTPSARLSTTGR